MWLFITPDKFRVCAFWNASEQWCLVINPRNDGSTWRIHFYLGNPLWTILLSKRSNLWSVTRGKLSISSQWDFSSSRWQSSLHWGRGLSPSSIWTLAFRPWIGLCTKSSFDQKQYQKTSSIWTLKLKCAKVCQSVPKCAKVCQSGPNCQKAKEQTFEEKRL